MNQALIVKLAWRSFNYPSALFTKIMTAKYKCNVKRVRELHNVKNHNSSWGWKGIKWGMEPIGKEIGWKVGKPTNIKLWCKKWVNGDIHVPMAGDEGMKDVIGTL